MSASEQPATATTTTPPAAQPVPQASKPASSSDGRGALLAALADALAGALGSVVAVAVFYPIDIAKTRAQASSPSTSSIPCKHPSLDNRRVGYRRDRGVAPSSAAGAAREGEEHRRWFRSRTLDALMSIVRDEGGLTRLYHGIEAKALQALLGSFIYFYAYAFIKGVMRRRAAVGGVGAAHGKSLRPSLNLLAAAMAGAVNQAITLPLENITTKMQTEPQHTQPLADAAGLAGEGSRDEAGAETIGGAEVAQEGLSSSEIIDSDFGGLGGDSTTSVDRGVGNGSGMGSLTHADADTRGGGGLRDTISCSNGTPATPAEMLPGGDGDHSNRRECMLPPARRQRRPRQSVAAVTGELYREGGGMGRFWRGFAPSLILTCNPAINYTAFDVLKALWLRRRNAGAVGSSIGGGATAAKAVGTAPTGPGRFLNPLEAFFVAAAAKSLATLITYPLIRAKVVLMTSPSSSSMPPSPIDGDNCPLDRRREVGVTPESRDGDVTRVERSRGGGNTDGVVCDVEIIRDGANDPLLFNGEVDAAAPLLADGKTAARKRGGEGNRSNTRGMAAVLMEIFRREGLGGLYAGCGAQLLHTILKSALLLATKEQIARAAASAVFLGGSRSAVGDSTNRRPGV